MSNNIEGKVVVITGASSGETAALLKNLRVPDMIARRNP
jgi:NADP-dependent 3-hydroxy acid dehydrogenase YdfG